MIHMGGIMLRSSLTVYHYYMLQEAAHMQYALSTPWIARGLRCRLAQRWITCSYQPCFAKFWPIWTSFAYWAVYSLLWQYVMTCSHDSMTVSWPLGQTNKPFYKLIMTTNWLVNKWCVCFTSLSWSTRKVLSKCMRSAWWLVYDLLPLCNQSWLKHNIIMIMIVGQADHDCVISPHLTMPSSEQHIGYW